MALAAAIAAAVAASVAAVAASVAGAATAEPQDKLAYDGAQEVVLDVLEDIFDGVVQACKNKKSTEVGREKNRAYTFVGRRNVYLEPTAAHVE